MKDLQRLIQLAHDQGSDQPTTATPLTRPRVLPDFNPGAAIDEAREVLADVRRGGAKYKDPSKGIKGLLRKQSKIDHLADIHNWDFSQVERRDAVEAAIMRGAGASLVQALMQYKTTMPFDVNQQCMEQPEGSGDTKKQLSKRPNNWLQRSTRSNAHDVVRLLASRGGKASRFRHLSHRLANNRRMQLTRLP